MKKLLLAIVCCALFCANADDDESGSSGGSYEDWFTPATAFAEQGRDAKLTYMDGDDEKTLTVDGLTLASTLLDCQAAVEDAISGASMSASAKNAFILAKLSLANSIKALLDTEAEAQQIASLGASIETIFSLTTADRVDSSGNTISSGKLQDGMRDKLLAKKNAVLGGKSSSSGEGGEDEPLKIVVTDFSYDTHEFEQIVSGSDDKKSKMGMKGYKNLVNFVGSAFPSATWLGATGAQGFVPFSSGYANGTANDLAWKSWAGFDSAIFKASTKDGKGGQVTFVGWDEGTKCAESMSKMLTDVDLADDRSKHSVLTRYGQANTGFTVHWVPIGDTVTAIKDVDEFSIVTNTALGGIADKKLSLYGVKTANTSASTDSHPRLPYVDGDENMKWAKPIDFLDDSVFEENENTSYFASLYGWTAALGNAASAEERYIPNADPENDELQWTKVSDLFNGNVFDVDSEGKVIIGGLNDIGENDIMVISVTGEDTEQEVEGVKFDGGQFEKSNGKLILKGSASASATCSAPLNVMLSSASDGQNRQRHRILALYTEGATREFHWVPITGTVGGITDVDDISITTNTANGASDNGIASLYGYATAATRAAGDGIPRIPNQNGTDDELQWSKLADLLDENEFEANGDDGKTQLLGFKDADEAAGEGEVPYISYVDGAGSLAWAGFDEFFADSVFKTSESTGKILLNGTSESSDKFSMLAIKTGENDSQTLGTFGFDRQSIDGEIGSAQTVQLHNFASPTDAVNGKNFADMLTNTSVSISGMGIPIRVANGTGGKPEIKYATLSKITGIPAANVDDKTIEINKEDENNQYLQLYRSKGEGITLEQGQVYGIGQDGKGQFLNLENPNDSLTTPSIIIDYSKLSNGYMEFNLNGVKSYDKPFVAGGDGNENYQGYDVDDSCVIEATGDDGKSLQLNGYSSATDHSIPVKDASGSKPIEWVSLGDKRLLMGKANDAPTGLSIGASLDTANVSATPTLNVKGFTDGGNCSASLNDMLSKDSESQNRANHQIMARYSTGSGTPSVHWIPINGTIGGGAPVDESSITTNTTNGAKEQGKASLYGFASSGTAQYAIPYKGSSNLEWLSKPSGASASDPKALVYNGSTLDWAKVGGGTALKIVGTESATAVVCTNTLTFASATDSNVKVTVTDGGNGNVTVTFGVYYK